MKRRLFLSMAFTLAALGISAQNSTQCTQSSAPCVEAGYYTNYHADSALVAKAKAWLAKDEWRQGFQGAAPHESVNAVDFYMQYQKNSAQWTKLFQYLAKTDLLALPKGKHPIPGSDLVISVEDSQNQPLEKRKSESHYRGIDFQYCVKGIERFGIIDHVSSVPNSKYRPDVVHYNYDKSKARFYDSTPDKFFIFFPGDWHIAKVANDTNDQNIRVCVIKVKWVE